MHVLSMSFGCPQMPLRVICALQICRCASSTTILAKQAGLGENRALPPDKLYAADFAMEIITGESEKGKHDMHVLCSGGPLDKTCGPRRARSGLLQGHGRASSGSTHKEEGSSWPAGG